MPGRGSNPEIPDDCALPKSLLTLLRAVAHIAIPLAAILATTGALLDILVWGWWFCFSY
jgi:hypothetical protein